LQRGWWSSPHDCWGNGRRSRGMAYSRGRSVSRKGVVLRDGPARRSFRVARTRRDRSAFSRTRFSHAAREQRRRVRRRACVRASRRLGGPPGPLNLRGLYRSRSARAETLCSARSRRFVLRRCRAAAHRSRTRPKLRVIAGPFALAELRAYARAAGVVNGGARRRVGASARRRGLQPSQREISESWWSPETAWGRSRGSRPSVATPPGPEAASEAAGTVVPDGVRTF
jgi:hypothetical protein